MPQAILLVDDNEINRQLVRHILAEDYQTIQEATNGVECLQALKRNSFDLVLLDLNMPVKSGFEVLEELQSSRNTGSTSGRLPAVIVLSADTDPTTISRSFQLGAADYVTTPFNRDELLARVNTHLALHNREQYLEERVQARTAELMATNRRLKETNDQLIQAEKMASLGQLAAGVAHEINNPVGYINSNLDTLKAYIGDLLGLLDSYQKSESHIQDRESIEHLRDARKRIDLDFLTEDIQHLIGESLQGVNRVKQIVRDLKGFSHPEPKAWQLEDLHQGINSTLNIVHNEIKYKAEVVKELGDIPLVECIGPQINQVLLNLLINASQAITDYGTITITTGFLPATANDEDRVFIRISDTGCGITSRVRKKIFDPFFTTKPVGEGTGLGLSVSYGIIQAHRGTIDVTSEVGQGSQFTLTLPVSQPPKTETGIDAD